VKVAGLNRDDGRTAGRWTEKDGGGGAGVLKHVAAARFEAYLLLNQVGRISSGTWVSASPGSHFAAVLRLISTPADR
jgi:hypothetical protein